MKNKINFSFLFPFFALFILNTSCISKQDHRIGFLLPNDRDARYLKDNLYFKEKASELRYDVVTQYAENDANLQEKQAVNLIDNGIKVLVISSVNQNLAAFIVRYAHENGVKVIAYERIIDNCPLDFMVGFDHKIVGEMQANYLLENCPIGNYIIIGGDKQDRNAELIYEGQMEVLKSHIANNRIKVLYQTFIEDWSADNASQEVKRIMNLSGEKINAVLSANDGMAGGIIKVFEEYQKLDRYWITGLDADLEACRRIVQGKQTMTVYKPFKTLASISAELAVQIMNNDVKMVANSKLFNGKCYVPLILLQPVRVDINNLKSTVISDGFHTMEEVYQ